MKVVRVMVSNIALPSKGIGSWTNLFDYYNQESTFFDYILSPGSGTGRFLNCKKRKWPTYFKLLRKFLLLNWVAKDYLDAIKNLSRNSDLIKVVVQDDLILLEALAHLKNNNKYQINLELTFYFHGFQLRLDKHLDEALDKVIFLSFSSYKSTLDYNLQFTPQAFIVGNFLNQNKFYDLDKSSKAALRNKFGIPLSSKVITWMANDRKVKGLHLFEKLMPILSNSYPDLYFLVIGSNSISSDSKLQIKSVGRVPQDVLADYLRSSDIYFFPSLWKEGFGLSVVEARLCGNWILASPNGSLKEVLAPFSNVFFVENPNIVEEWVKVFGNLYTALEKAPIDAAPLKSDAYSYEGWVNKFESSIG